MNEREDWRNASPSAVQARAELSGALHALAFVDGYVHEREEREQLRAALVSVARSLAHLGGPLEGREGIATTLELMRKYV
jgi:hypothetical protein